MLHSPLLCLLQEAESQGKPSGRAAFLGAPTLPTPASGSCSLGRVILSLSELFPLTTSAVLNPKVTQTKAAILGLSIIWAAANMLS